MTFDERVHAANLECEEAIGAVWVKYFPEVKTGDFPPDAHFNLAMALERALETWLDWNHPERQ